MSVQKVDKTTGNTTLIAGATLWADSPIGTILPYGGTNIPAGFLLCDGAEKNKTDYPELYAVIGDAFGTASVNTKFVLPDLREATTKGAGLTGKSNNHYDSDGVALGEFVEDRVQDHTHSFATDGTTGANWAVISGNKTTNDPSAARVFKGGVTSATARTGDTTEVKAVGVNFIIKAKMVALPADLESAVEDAVEDALDGIGTITKATTNIGTAVSCASQSTTILTSISLDAGTYVLSASADHTSANAEAVISITEGSAINDEFKQFISSVTAYSANTGNVTAILKLTATTTVRLVCWSAGNLNVTPHSLVATKVA